LLGFSMVLTLAPSRCGFDASLGLAMALSKWEA
jgi:hypothetical protein